MPSSLNIHTEIESTQATERLEELRSNEYPAERRRLTRIVIREVLRRTIARHPVDTGRSQAAWSAALTQLGGTPPPRIQGTNPAAIDEGTAASKITQSHNHSQTQIEVTNAIDYEPHLEFGTQNIPPFQMVQQALTETRHKIQQLAANT